MAQKKTLKTTQFSVKIEGYTEGVAKLVGIYADANYLADSARISPDGSFVFKKPEGYQEGLFYVLMPDQANFQFLIANGENNFNIKTVRGKIVLSLTAENSSENQLFFDNQKYQVRLEERFNELLKERKKYLIGSPRYDSLQKAQENLLVERDSEVTKLIQNFGNTFFTKFKLAGQNPKFRFSTLTNGVIDTAATMRNYREDWWNDVDFSDERLVRTPVFF
ncbi:MAG: DUF4369 domain-containing protein [Saprospiraceae bacterium]|nr:DUF4369 domain-containing protein [Saprospiraceae bacterium]